MTTDPETADKLRLSLDRRIMGLETEYGAIFMNGGKCVMTPEKLSPYLLQALQGDVLGDFKFFFNIRNNPENSTGGYSGNGARIYVDTGNHLEYAMPEVTNPRDLVRYDKAGERIFELIACQATKLINYQGLEGKLYFFKNNVAKSHEFGGYTSFGCHENYLVSRLVPFDALRDLLVPFLVTRQIFAGSGMFYREEGIYEVSQRAKFIQGVESSVTTGGKRGIINTKDEPLCDRKKFRRLHLIIGDSNMSEYTTYLKAGTTASLIHLVEEALIMDKLRFHISLKNPVLSMREISSDLTLRAKVGVRGGGRWTALQIQREYLNLARRLYDENHENIPENFPMEEILDKWEFVLRSLAIDPMQLSKHIDWVIKLNMINRCKTNEEKAMINLQYHGVNRGNCRGEGLYNTLEKNSLVERIVTDHDIEDAIVNPPQDTRAKIRGACITSLEDSLISVGWDEILPVGYTKIPLCDPFQTHNLKLEEFRVLRNVSMEAF